MTRALALLRRIPLLGWLVAGAVLVVLYALRQRRMRLAAEAAVGAQRRLLDARARLDQATVRAERGATAERRAAEADLRAAEDDLVAAARRIYALEGADLAAEVDRVFGRRAP